MKKIFYQSSLPRSGSTLLQNILAQNPNIYSTPTSPMCDYVTMLREVYTNNPNVLAQDESQMKVAFQNMSKCAINGFFDSLTDKDYVIDKSRAWIPNYNFLTFINGEEPKIICMVRDLRDVFASNEKNYRKNPHKSGNTFGIGNGTTVPKRIDIWASSENFTGGAIEFLQDSLYTGLSEKILFVKYENLCLYPDDVIKRVYNFLEIPFYHHDFDDVQQLTHENDQLHGIFGVHKIRNRVEMIPSDANSVLGGEVCDWIYNNYKWFYNYFDYKY